MSRSKAVWTARELAFIIGFADYCIHHGCDYKDEFTVELQKFSSRRPSYKTLMKKLSRFLESYGNSNVTPSDLRTKGTGRIDFTLIPADVRAELDGWREYWGFPRLEADAALTVDHNLESPENASNPDGGMFGHSAEEQSGVQMRPEERTRGAQVDETPEPQYEDMSGLDGTADRPTMSPISPAVGHTSDRISSPDYAPTPSPPAQRATGKKRSITLEDTDDDDYHPSPKRNKTARTSSARLPFSVSKDAQGPIVDKHVANRTGVAIPKVRSPRAQIPTQIPRESAPIITIDDETEQVQPVEEVRPVAAREAHPEQQDLVSRDQGPSKRSAFAMDETKGTTTEPSPKRHETGGRTLESVDNKVDACLSILSSLVTHQTSLPEEVAEHIHQLVRTVKDSKNSVLENLETDLRSQRALKAKYSDLVRKLIEFVDLSTDTVFPKAPPQNEVDRLWAAFHEYVVSIVGPNHVKPTISPPSAGYMAASAENIAHSRIPEPQLEAYIGSFAFLLRSPQAQQLIFSALLCRWVFTDPETMLEDMHSPAMLHLYGSMLSSANTHEEGLARVQHHDQIATKLLLEDPAFQSAVIKRQKEQVESMFANMKKKLCTPSNIPSSMRPEKFASELVDLKMRLVLSPKDYRIRYFRPGTHFDSSTMRAFNQDNDRVSEVTAAGKKIALCIFPALTCQDPEAITASSKIEDVLVKNKRILPTFKEMTTLPPNVQLSKAVVLVLMNSGQK